MHPKIDARVPLQWWKQVAARQAALNGGRGVAVVGERLCQGVADGGQHDGLAGIQLARQLFAESLFLALVAGAVGGGSPAAVGTGRSGDCASGSAVASPNAPAGGGTSGWNARRIW